MNTTIIRGRRIGGIRNVSPSTIGSPSRVISQTSPTVQNSEDEIQSNPPIDDEDEEIVLSVMWMGPPLVQKRDIWGRTISPFAAPDDAYTIREEKEETQQDEKSVGRAPEISDDEKERRATLKYEDNRIKKERELKRPLLRYMDSAFSTEKAGNATRTDSFGFPIFKQSFRDFPYCGTREVFVRKDTENE